MQTTLRAPGSSDDGSLADFAYASSYGQVATSPRENAARIRSRVGGSASAEQIRTACAPHSRAAAFTAAASCAALERWEASTATPKRERSVDRGDVIVIETHVAGAGVLPRVCDR